MSATYMLLMSCIIPFCLIAKYRHSRLFESIVSNKKAYEISTDDLDRKCEIKYLHQYFFGFAKCHMS